MKNVAVLAGLLLCVLPASAQSPRLAYVDSEKILTDLPEAQQVQKELETTVKGWQEELQRLSDEFQKAVEEYQKKEAVLSASARETQQKALADMRQKAQDYQMKKFGQGGEMQELREKRFSPIREKILKAIETVAKDEGFNFVFDRASDVVLLYADTKFDLTYKVLDELKRGSASAKSK
ncbi:MAG: membrane protein [Bacteroidia bacterium]|nr:MAG: membrane protein [Bacteroidia bacterium]